MVLTAAGVSPDSEDGAIAAAAAGVGSGNADGAYIEAELNDVYSSGEVLVVVGGTKSAGEGVGVVDGESSTGVVLTDGVLSAVVGVVAGVYSAGEAVTDGVVSLGATGVPAGSVSGTGVSDCSKHKAFSARVSWTTYQNARTLHVSVVPGRSPKKQ